MNGQRTGPLTIARTPIVGQLVLWLLLLASLAPLSAWSQLSSDEPPLLAVEEAFTFTAVPRGPLVRIQARAQDGYYLYRDRIHVESRTPGVELGAALMPAGEEKDDPLFGRVQVYRGLTLIDIPLSKAPAPGTPFEIALSSQGCADLGVCYPPDVRILQVTLGAAISMAGSASNPVAGLFANQSQAARPDQLRSGANGEANEEVDAKFSVLERLGLAFGDATSAGGSGVAGDSYLLVDEAFALRTPRFDANAVVIAFDIAPGYYLYRSRISVELSSPPDARLGPVQLPEGKQKNDEYFGEQQVYYGSVQMRVPVQSLPARSADAPSTLRLKVVYQGCADAGLCYPPQERVIEVRVPAMPLAMTSDTSSSSSGGTLSETDLLALSITNDTLALVLGTFFIAGLLLAFTPCVLPMVPILSAIIAGQQDSPNAKSGLALSIVYVLAMSLTYTAAGVIAGLFGQNLQALFQHPAVLIGFSAVFVALALAMFGFYELQVPLALQTRLATFSHRRRGGSYLGVGTMGVLSALIVGPCVAAPLAAALIVIGTAGDPLRGGLALFVLSLGMGVPLLAVGAFGPRLLPRVGPWMVLVRQLFGVMLLAVAIYLLSRILPEVIVLALWSALALLSAVLIFRSGVVQGGQHTPPARPRSLMRNTISFGVAAYALVLAIGAATGANDPLRPLAGVFGAQHSTLQFERVKSVADLQRVVTQANSDGRIVMLDFYADWCVSCIEMERETFVAPAVHAALNDAVLIQADVTAYDAADKALLDRFGLHGPPAILFFGLDGRERRAFRVIGFMDADEFASHAIRARRS